MKRLAHYDELPNLQDRPGRQIREHQEPPERKQSSSTEQVPVSAYGGSLKNLKDLKDLKDQSSPLILLVREVARCHGTPLHCGQATVPVLASPLGDIAQTPRSKARAPVEEEGS